MNANWTLVSAFVVLTVVVVVGILLVSLAPLLETVNAAIGALS